MRDASPRLLGPDVTRAIALVGVVVMNYHGYLNGTTGSLNPSYAERVFDTVDGPLTTRFAATFVLVAGIGVTLLTNRGRLAGDRESIRQDRWRLVRRGVLLYAFGLLIEWIWHGTILFYYGAFFVVAAVLFTLRIRWLIVIGAVAALAAAVIAWVRLGKRLNGDNVTWLNPRVTSPRNLLLRTFIGSTHPLLPWLAFLCAGMILGRFLPTIATWRLRVIGAGLALFVGTYLVNFVGLRLATDSFASADRTARLWRGVLSTGPFDRGLLYTIGTLGSSLVAYCTISWLAEEWPSSPVTVGLAHAGQMTLTLYVCHVLVFNAMVHWWGQVTATGLDTALVFGLVFWVIAIPVGALWHRFAGMGPLERFYRAFGG